MRDHGGLLVSAPDDYFDAYVFDLDGTIYLGEELLPGARELLEHLRERGTQRVFLSNNPTKTPAMYRDRLERLGVAVDLSEVTNTVVSTVRWILSERPGAKVFPIADPPLVEAIRDAGITITDDPREITLVVASYDHGFTYQKLQVAFDALWRYRGAELITTNPDRYCPFPDGAGEPDAAGIVAAIEATTGVSCSFNMGKPDQIMIDVALENIVASRNRVVMVGDRLSTDIRMAHNAGIRSALVLTGEAAELKSLEGQEFAPDFVVSRIDQLAPGLVPTGVDL